MSGSVFGFSVASARSAMDLTQVQFAHLMGVHPLTVSKWECGRAMPTAHQFALMRAYLQMPPLRSIMSGLTIAYEHGPEPEDWNDVVTRSAAVRQRVR